MGADFDETSAMRRVEVVKAIRKALADLAKHRESNDLTDISEAVVLAVRADVPDCTNEDLGAAAKFVEEEKDRVDQILLAVQHVVDRMSHPPRASERIPEIIKRAALAGDPEAQAILLKIREPVERSYLSSQANA